MARIRNTWELAKASWEVLKADKELLALPVMSAVAVIVVALAFIAPVALIGNELSQGAEELDPGPLGYILLAMGYFAATFVGIFFNAALVSGAHERLTGGDPTVRSALRGASSRFHRLLPWALLTGTVGLILQAIEARFGFLGDIIARLVGVAWRLVTFLVIPVLVIEDVGPIDGLKRSGTLFKKTWGENVAASVGFGLLGLALIIPAVIVAGLLIATEIVALMVIGVVAAVVWVIGSVVVVSALSGIFQTALYLYAVNDQVPEGFDQAALAGAFTPRRGTRGPTGFAG